MTNFSLADLEAIVTRRAASDDQQSYTAKLVRKGLPKATKKLGEEAVELVIAALAETKEEVVGESADLLYHLMVVLHLRGIALADVMAELERRTAETGLQEKARRPKDSA